MDIRRLEVMTQPRTYRSPIGIVEATPPTDGHQTPRAKVHARRGSAFSMAALLSLEQSTTPKFANSAAVSVPLYHHFQRQLEEPF